MVRRLARIFRAIKGGTVKFIRTAVVAVAVAAALSAGSLATAQASTRATPAPGALSANHVLEATAPAQGAITCSVTGGLRIGRPSATQPRKVTNVDTIRCSKAMPTFRLTVGLYRNGTKVAARTFTNHGRRSITGSVSRGCKGTAAWYRGHADVRIVLPPGYVPHVFTAHLKTRAVRVACWR